MTPDEFIASGQRIFGLSGWQKQLAQRLAMSPETISRYSKGRLAIPVTVALAMKGLESSK